MQMVSLILIRLIMIYVVDSAVFSFWEPSQAWLIILCKNIPRLNVTFWEGDPGCKVGLGTSQGQDWRIQKFHRLKRQPMFSEAFHTRWCQPFYFRIGIPVSPILNGKCFLFPLRKREYYFFYSHLLKSPQPLPSISLLVQRHFYPGGIIDVMPYFISPVVAIHSCMIKWDLFSRGN